MIDSHKRDLREVRQMVDEGKVSGQTFENVNRVRRNEQLGDGGETIVLFERRYFVVNFVIW